MVKRILFLVLRCGAFLVALTLIFLNVKWYFAPATQPEVDLVPPRAIAQLSWLRGALDDGAAEDMQGLFPEGFFFCHELYGLAWVEVGLRSAEHRDQAIQEARRALIHIESPKGTSAFAPSLPPGHGMFYAGWRNHLQAGIVLLSRDKTELAQLASRCDKLRAALEASPAWPWLASYPDQVWPCDAPPGLHAMRIYDHVTGENRYEGFIETWLEAVQRNLDSTFGMITHTADPASGTPIGTPRGTSQTIILRFLRDIDPDFAAGQYRKFQAQFHHSFLKVPAILEYPRGTRGPADVDSGPLVSGISGSATVVGMGVAQLYGDHEFARAISQTGETIGFPFGTSKRRYMGGFLPVGDGFLVHATTARPWINPEPSLHLPGTPVPPSWRLPTHLLSLLLGVGLYAIWRQCAFSAGEETSVEDPMEHPKALGLGQERADHGA